MNSLLFIKFDYICTPLVWNITNFAAVVELVDTLDLGVRQEKV